MQDLFKDRLNKPTSSEDGHSLVTISRVVDQVVFMLVLFGVSMLYAVEFRCLSARNVCDAHHICTVQNETSAVSQQRHKSAS